MMFIHFVRVCYWSFVFRVLDFAILFCHGFSVVGFVLWSYVLCQCFRF